MKKIFNQPIWKISLIIGTILIGMTIWSYGRMTENSHKMMEIHAIDVKEGGLLLIKTSNENILIGGARKEEANYIKTYLQGQAIRKLDLVIWHEPRISCTGAYRELIQEIPIDTLEIYNPDQIDEETRMIKQDLEKAQCQVKLNRLSKRYKSQDRTVQIAPIALPIKEDLEAKTIAFEIEGKQMKYLWMPLQHAIEQKQLIELIERATPHVINISGKYRKEGLESIKVEQKSLKALVVGGMNPLTKEENDNIKSIASTALVLINYKEKRIILYKKSGKYYFTTGKEMNTRVF